MSVELMSVECMQVECMHVKCRGEGGTMGQKLQNSFLRINFYQHWKKNRAI